MQHRHFLRDVHSADLFEILLVAAIVAVLTVRTLLALTGYPHLGGRHLHIAHVLWGGLLMIVGLIVLFRYWNPSARRLAALVAGIGFGLFIDEVGKFLTQDNNYFYRPAIALIYVVFILMFLLLRTMGRRKAFEPQELSLNDELEKLDTAPGQGTPTWYHRAAAFIKKRYASTVRHSWFTPFLFVVFVLLGTSQLLVASGFLFYRPTPTYLSVLQTVVAAGSTSCILMGLIALTRSRMHAYPWFHRAVRINIFVTQPFLFYSWQLGALVGLGANVAFYSALRYVMRTDKPYGVRAGCRSTEEGASSE